MNISIRVDASVMIGTGHVMRCLTLAEILFKRGAKVIFICRLLEGNMQKYIQSLGFATLNIPPDADDVQFTLSLLQAIGDIDMLIVDHYDLDALWESEMRPFAKRIMVIDDLANRPHDCDLLLNQNYLDNPKERYSGYVSNECLMFIGPQYSLLRSEFINAVDKTNLSLEKGVSLSIRNILVFFSGSDPTDETRKAIRALAEAEFSNLNIDVVIGASNPHRESIEALCKLNKGFRYHCQIDYMAQLMASADLAIGGGGTTTWERCYMHLPAIVTILADNQREVVDIVADVGAIYNLGWHAEVSETTIRNAVRVHMIEPQRIELMKQACAYLMPEHNIGQLIDVIMGGFH